jgi:hypothetical protein
LTKKKKFYYFDCWSSLANITDPVFVSAVASGSIDQVSIT